MCRHVNFPLTKKLHSCQFLGMTLSQFLDQRGAAVRIARQLGVAASTVSRWASRRVPAARVQDLARVTGIPARKLRPDLAAAFKPKALRK